ncbi:MAG TPA: Ig-like domain-containing domain [Bacteroidia bacterium]|nr:Ig-like domain-containing domain [Bacteroidia bacterium]
MFSFILLLASCAQILSPGGGDKDVTPPVVVHYLPDSAATNFTGKRIVIRFNEYVQLNDLQNQLVISPPLKHDPDVNIRRKEIVIDINDTLQPNTTYSLSFGSSIKDITEGNVLDNFRYVFSTGPVIDSIHLGGKILDASTLNGKSGVLVMLYNNNDDSAPYKQRPYYFTKTRSDGSFMITNIRAGSYKVFALVDKNQNYLYDKPDEEIAFANAPVNLNANVDTLKLKLFHEIPGSQKELRADGTKNHITLVYSQPIKDLKVPIVLSGDERAGFLLEHSAHNDTLDLWFSDLKRDSINIPVYDGSVRIDSARIHFAKQGKSGRTSRGDVLKTVMTSNVTSGKNFDPLQQLVLHSSNPLKSFDPKFIILTHGKDTVKNDLSMTENHFIRFNYTFAEDSAYALLVLPGAVTDWFGKTNDTLKQSFKVELMDNYASLKVKLTNIVPGNYVVQLLNEKGNILAEQKIDGTSTAMEFDHLLAGQYHLKLIVDDNKNGEWDTGNYHDKRQPEKVVFYGGVIKMRTGWDMDIDWVF